MSTDRGFCRTLSPSRGRSARNRSPLDGLLAAVNVVCCSGDASVGHEVDGKRGDVGRADHSNTRMAIPVSGHLHGPRCKRGARRRTRVRDHLRGNEPFTNSHLTAPSKCGEMRSVSPPFRESVWMGTAAGQGTGPGTFRELVAYSTSSKVARYDRAPQRCYVGENQG